MKCANSDNHTQPLYQAGFPTCLQFTEPILCRRTPYVLIIAHITKTRLFKYIENFTSKTEKFQIKKSNIFHISAQNIDCEYSLEPPRRGGSNEYPQSMFLSRNKKNNVYPCKRQFYYIKVGFKGVKIIWACFRDEAATSFTIQIHF